MKQNAMVKLILLLFHVNEAIAIFPTKAKNLKIKQQQKKTMGESVIKVFFFIFYKYLKRVASCKIPLFSNVSNKRRKNVQSTNESDHVKKK